MTAIDEQLEKWKIFDRLTISSLLEIKIIDRAIELLREVPKIEPNQTQIDRIQEMIDLVRKNVFRDEPVNKAEKEDPAMHIMFCADPDLHNCGLPRYNPTVKEATYQIDLDKKTADFTQLCKACMTETGWTFTTLNMAICMECGSE